MNEKEIIKKATEYVNLFGYIQWNELKTINFNNDSSTWIISFSAKQNIIFPEFLCSSEKTINQLEFLNSKDRIQARIPFIMEVN